MKTFFRQLAAIIGIAPPSRMWAPETIEASRRPIHNDDSPRPLTREELLQWLDNIGKMHRFSQNVDYGGPTHHLYLDGMPRAAAFIADCVKLTPPGTI